ncbi:retinol dehydrogenase 14 [Trypanosoma rangeli]|uniref:Retinol dehydrogenase 14 n=1 Tax=Trypanosoma rangeli TaxID=5698 RepID=A0A3R7NQF7_TRYRA|nr:retinol dehydrogenase 14 [Trypanosoma rangeli]RNF06109.1 retinol dehydrogenase 14 [Trypanosoma rangeli]|eukprot:RNF06109.1 retinol dehydrogenase 14 [Trypanosoma rangeli]
MHLLAAIIGYVCFVLRGILVALVDFYIMCVRVGFVWRRRCDRQPSMGRRDLVMQLAPQSPRHSRLSSADMILALNEPFLDRALWMGLDFGRAQPTAIVTGVSYGGIGFYVALNLILCGFNVHGVCRTLQSVRCAERKMQFAVERQCKLHKGWVGKTGRLIAHVCDMSDTVAVSNLCTVLLRDANIRVVVCGAGCMATPPRLSPQRLEEQFAAQHLGHGLLMLRLLQHRIQQLKVCTSARPRWRFVVVSCAFPRVTDPTQEDMFHSYEDDEEAEFCSTFNRYDGWSRAEMCRLLFALALSRYVERDRRLAPFCTVNVLHPGPTRSRMIANSRLPLAGVLDSSIGALLRLSPAITALYVTDLCLSKRLDDTNGHFFRMGDDQAASFTALQKNAEARVGFWVNSLFFTGIPAPAISMSTSKQNALWRFTLSYLTSHALLDAKIFRQYGDDKLS